MSSITSSNSTGYSFTSAGVSRLLHGMRHINHQFKPVSNKFEIPTNYQRLTLSNANNYAQSIQMFFILTLTILVILLLIKFCIATIQSCVHNSRDDDDMEVSGPVFACRICLLIVALVGAFGALGYAVSLGNSIQAIFTDIGSFVTVSANTTQIFANNTAIILSGMTSDLQGLNATSTPIYSTVAGLSASLPANSSFAGEQIWKTISNGITTGGTFLRAGVMGVAAGAAALAVFCWFLALVDECFCRRTAAAHACTCLNSCSDNCCCTVCLSFSRLLFEITFFVMSLVLAVLIALVFAGSVAVSDVCASFDNTLVSTVNVTTGGSLGPIVEYYVYCNTAKYGDPYANVSSAVTSLSSLQTQVNSTVANARAHYPPASSQFAAAGRLNTSYYKLQTNVEGLYLAVSCLNFQAPLQATKTTICSSVVANLFGFYMMLGIFIFFLNVRELTTCCMHSRVDGDDPDDAARRQELAPLV